jgi:hypothetical protein
MQGRTVGAGGAGDAIRAIQPAPAAGLADCCSEVLKRLDKLDAIERMLMDLADQNKKLADEVARLRQNQDAMAGRIQPPPPAPPAPPTTEEVATAVTDAIAKKQLPKFQLLGMNVGANSDGNASFTGKGRYFAPFGNNYAFQSEGEYFYSKGQREGQFDFGLVDRINRFQAGLFGSFKHVNLTGDQTGGTLGQGALTMEYLFKWGKIGVFGTKAFLDDALVNSANVITPSGVLLNNLFTERYLRVVDQAGMSGTFALFGKSYAEGNLGYLRSTTAGDRVGGTLRLIFPVTNKIAFTLEGGMNETLLGPGNNGRVVAGVQFGNALRPTDYLESKHPVPAQIPRLRYEVLTRTVRKGNSAPVADAGPNQILPGGATVTLDGSASYDPDGDPITFQWVQESGPAVMLSAPTAKITNFPAATGQNYSFRLTVKDPYGAQGIARVSITAGTPAASAPLIATFTANPTTINAGQSSTLSWQVSNADTVVITGLGSVALNGSQAVTPATTTTYTLTATHGSQTATAQATVTVNSGSGLPVIVSFAANPATIDFGQSSSLSWVVQNATTVTIDNSIGTVGLTGSHAISPASTTTYTITASNANGSVTAQAKLTVIGSVQILSFTATPSTVASGAISVLVCQTAGAVDIKISGLDFTNTNNAVASVHVIQTVSYTCTATGADGQTASAQVTVNVVGPIDPALPK